MRVPPNEKVRLTRIAGLRLHELQQDASFQDLLSLASRLCGCETAALSLIGRSRQEVVASIGDPLPPSMSRETSPCSETILGADTYVVSDLRGDPRFRQGDLVTTGIVFYAGAPIVTSDNLAIGTLCVLHTTPRDLTVEQEGVLLSLSRQAARYLELYAELSNYQNKISSLGESERRFRAIADASPMLLWISDDGGNRTFFNSAWCEYTGLTREESIADQWREAIHPDDRELYLQKWQETCGTNIRFQREFRLRHRSGTYRWVLEQALPMFSSSGRLEGYVSSCVDLTSRIEGELHYQSNEARFRAVSEAAPLGIFVTDSDGNFIYTNHQYQRISGQSFEESLGSGWLQAVPEEERSRVMQSWYTTTRSANPFEEVHRFVRPDGTIAWASVKAAAINATDTVSGWVGTVEDITARLKTDEELRSAKQSAEAAMHAKGQFLANMSHEIRTPLTAMIGFAESLRDDLIQSPNQLHCLDVILSNGRHLLEIINDILDLSKIDAGALTIERSPFSPVELMEEIRLMFAPRVAEKALSFSIHYEWPLPASISSDRLRVKQVLINLLSNAIKFTEKGWIEVRVSFDSRRGDLRFTISDSGVGISHEQQQRLFKPFSQANESITRRFGGTGLGLNIAAHLVRALGGEISIESTPHKGSTFTFFIHPELNSAAPLLSAIPVEEPHSHTSSRPHRSLKGRVLFADDALDNRRLVHHLLKKAGVEPTLVEDGKQAIDAALTNEFDLILMDIQMPNIDGLTATRTLREGGIRVPIVALSAGAMTSDVLQAIEAGCSTHLAKPFTKDSFYEMLERFLEVQDSAESDTVLVSSKLSDDAEMNSLLVAFIDTVEPRVAEIQGATEQCAWDAVATLAHKLRGSAGLYGYPELMNIAKAIEEMAKETPLEVPKLCEELREIGAKVSAGRTVTQRRGAISPAQST